ncbi:MAG: MMPL family transporter [Frankia sp.]|nr:MMPL family transporter [Frankia sp.]
MTEAPPLARDGDVTDSAAAAGRADGSPAAGSSGPLGRLGIWTVRHGRAVTIAWLVIVVVLGVFAPRVEKTLSGAGWQANGSESVQVRERAGAEFAGANSAALMVVVRTTEAVTGPVGQEAIAAASALLQADPRVRAVGQPQIAPDGHTAVLLGGAAASTSDMVRAADDLEQPLRALNGPGVTVSLTGASGMWADFNRANLEAMLHSELISWPVTLAILVLAFGSLVAAGLPLLLTLAGLVAAAGSLTLLAELFDVSIWAMNFAMMFALALGIDYALFMVVRFRNARFGRGADPVAAVAETMDTAGKAVAFSGLTVLASLSAVMLVPSPAFRSMAAGIMLAVVFVLAASLTLLPPLLARLGDRVNAAALPWVRQGEHRSARFTRWGERLWRRPARYGLTAFILLAALAAPVIGLRTGMPSITVVPPDASSRVGYTHVAQAFGPGAPGALQVIAPAEELGQVERVLAADPGIAHVSPALVSADERDVLVQATPTVDPSDPALSAVLDRLRATLPPAALVGGAAAENLDLHQLLSDRTPLVLAAVLVMGFLLLLVVLAAPLAAALGVLTNLLATGAAFGVARLVFADGHGADLLGFTPQGFLDAWGPIFFFAMIFAIAMDYTVFLLASAKEHWERSGDAREAVVGGLAHSGRVIFAAAAVMVAVFFTFALSGPLPPKEMGIILGVAVLLDAALVRLVLLPVLLRLAGPAAWHSPAWLRRVLPRITFAH